VRAVTAVASTHDRTRTHQDHLGVHRRLLGCRVAARRGPSRSGHIEYHGLGAASVQIGAQSEM